ncbi:hypothetical protein [Shewanella sp. SR43-8]|uniref:hypothetical protein n=1 Tax=Shewanella sp. SR43-8 TaxID=2760938 RepID=UPI001603C235|nr:hypothetical protein [Shewanella sp. SR43-8]MBB1320568.1 hypothetical protein [Shewanella sp. SR43-8]|tara:strand:- start:2343 stop:2675 length:333 start_codon:yes stop_codon:yes gene_type:complete
MDMPTPCPHCGNVVELNDMVSHPNEFKSMVCEECHDLIETENNQGSFTDDYGNKLTWVATPDDGLLEIYVNGKNITTWGYEDDPEAFFSDFMAIWNKAQASTKSGNGGAA